MKKLKKQLFPVKIQTPRTRRLNDQIKNGRLPYLRKNLATGLMVQFEKDTKFHENEEKIISLKAGEDFQICVKTKMKNLQFLLVISSKKEFKQNKSTSTSFLGLKASGRSGNTRNGRKKIVKKKQVKYVKIFERTVKEYDEEKCGYFYNILIEKSETYLLTMKLFGEHNLSNSPCCFKIAPNSVDLSRSVVKIPQNLYKNIPFPVLVRLKDKHNNVITNLNGFNQLIVCTSEGRRFICQSYNSNEKNCFVINNVKFENGGRKFLYLNGILSNKVYCGVREKFYLYPKFNSTNFSRNYYEKTSTGNKRKIFRLKCDENGIKRKRKDKFNVLNYRNLQKLKETAPKSLSF